MARIVRMFATQDAPGRSQVGPLILEVAYPTADGTVVLRTQLRYQSSLAPGAKRQFRLVAIPFAPQKNSKTSLEFSTNSNERQYIELGERRYEIQLLNSKVFRTPEKSRCRFDFRVSVEPSLTSSVSHYQSVEQLLNDGWIVQLLSSTQDTSLPEEILLIANRNAATHIALLRKNDALLWFGISNSEDLRRLEAAEAHSRKVVEQFMRIRCGAKNIDGDVEVGNFVRNIIELTGWSIKPDESGFEFSVDFRVDGGLEAEGHSRITELEDVLIALSIKNKIGFEIRQLSWSKASLAFPVHVTVDKGRTRPEFIDKSDLARVRDMRFHDELDLVSSISHWYRQVSQRSRIIFGFSLLESLLGSEKQQNILTDEELSKVVTAIKESDSVDLSQDKLKRIRDALTNNYSMFMKSRNERIADRIVEILGISVNDARSKVKEISKLRGEFAHTADDSTIQRDRPLEIRVRSACAFIEEVLYAYLSQRVVSHGGSKSVRANHAIE